MSRLRVESLYGVKPGSLVTWNVLCSGAAGGPPIDGATLHRMEFHGDFTP